MKNKSVLLIIITLLFLVGIFLLLNKYILKSSLFQYENGSACSPVALQQGDLLFQTSSGSAMGQAISNATAGAGDRSINYAHVGMAVPTTGGGSKDKREMYIIEATEWGVVLTQLDTFLSRPVRTHVFRLKQEYQQLIPQTIKYCFKQIGAGYDSAFIQDNGKYYCSELITEAFRYANEGRDFFPLIKMTFKQNGQFIPYWVEWYKSINTPIPEGTHGSNPNALSQDSKIIKILNQLDH